MTAEIRILPIPGIREVTAGDDLAALICEAAQGGLEERDVVVVTQKVVSKAEGRMVPAEERATAIAAESVRILRRSATSDMVISQTRHGFVCANAGVDASNVPEGTVALLPLDPDLSARRIRKGIERHSGRDVGVVISDTFGRAWRVGQTDVAIGVAGIEPLVDLRGSADAEGNVLNATLIAVADEIAGAAEMVMGKAERVCAAIVRGAPVRRGRGSASELVRAPSQDLFR